MMSDFLYCCPLKKGMLNAGCRQIGMALIWGDKNMAFLEFPGMVSIGKLGDAGNGIVSLQNLTWRKVNAID